jgi:peptidoglycan/LPS O-acetylase OafA/YrhL
MMFSWKVFVPLSRLNYSTYLIHMAVVQAHAGSIRTPGYLNDYDKVSITTVAFVSLIRPAVQVI